MNIVNTFVHPWAVQSRTTALSPWVTLSTWPTIEAAVAEEKRQCRFMGRMLRYRIRAR